MTHNEDLCITLAELDARITEIHSYLAELDALPSMDCNLWEEWTSLNEELFELEAQFENLHNQLK